MPCKISQSKNPRIVTLGEKLKVQKGNVRDSCGGKHSPNAMEYIRSIN